MTMSGGHFDYQQHRFNDIAEEIERIIRDNGVQEPDGWEAPRYEIDTIARFREAIALLRCAYVYVQRIDWLVSCDDSEADFHRRLHNNLEALEKEEKA